MTLTTTFKRLRAAGACKDRYKFLRAALKGTKDTTPINLLTILETNGLNDALWALKATAENCDVLARAAEAAAWAARAAEDAAWAAAGVAWAAGDAARAAGDAARAKQREIFISYLQPEASK
jgi:hypothetical protein